MRQKKTRAATGNRSHAGPTALAAGAPTTELWPPMGHSHPDNFTPALRVIYRQPHTHALQQPGIENSLNSCVYRYIEISIQYPQDSV